MDQSPDLELVEDEATLPSAKNLQLVMEDIQNYVAVYPHTSTFKIMFMVHSLVISLMVSQLLQWPYGCFYTM